MSLYGFIRCCKDIKIVMAARRKQKSIATSKAQKMRADLINNLIKHTVVKSALNKKNVDENIESSEISTIKHIYSKSSVNDVFKLPELTNMDGKEYISSDDSDSSMQLSPRKQTKWMGNIHSVDLSTAEFKSLPADVRYDILTDLKETRKQSSWGRLHEMPEETNKFSTFQMKRLLKRRFVQESLETAEKEMGGKTLTLEELEKLLTEQGVQTNRDNAYRIASDSTSRVIYISDKDKLIRNTSTEDKTSKEDVLEESINEEVEPVAGPSGITITQNSLNKFQLSDGDSDSNLTSYSNSVPIIDNINEYEFGSDWESESEKNESLPFPNKYLSKNNINPALAYMLEHSGLTQEQIIQLMEQNRKESKTKITDTHSSGSTKSLSALDSTTNNVMKHQQMKEDNITEDNILDVKEIVEKNISLYSVSENSTSNVTTESIEHSSSDLQFIKDNDEIISCEERVECQKQPVPIRNMRQLDTHTTDSDSDEFIEIPDVPVLYSKEITKKHDIEITFKSDDKIEEDDIFADVFKEPSRDIFSHFTESAVTSSSIEHTVSKIVSEDLNKNKTKNEDKSELSGTLISKSCSFNEISLDKNSIDSDKNKERVHMSIQSSIVNEEESKKIQNNNTLIDAESKIVSDEGKLSEDTTKGKQENILPRNETELLELKANLEHEQIQLTETMGKLERQATDISDQIRIEAQELLRLFGIPYVVAPMEAEAQCAYLEQINLTDGTITDDSDIWLFGGQCVYKNFFNNNKTVLQFQSCDIQHHFKLTRHQLIQLALLVGSDYTTGIPGIGPVTALEILAAFPTQGDNLLHGLINFCLWIQRDKAIDSSKKSLRNKLKNIQIEKGFPSQAVVQAYMFPAVDESKEKFTWGRPNLILLSDYTSHKFGWTKDKFNEIIKPVIKRMEESKQQQTIESYFKLKAIPKSIEMNLSKRIKKAVNSLNGNNVELNTNETDTNEKMGKRVNKRVPKTLNKRQKSDSIDLIESKDISKKLMYNTSINDNDKNIKEYIPQREKDKANSLKRKMHAIEVFRKSKSGLDKTKKIKRNVRKMVQEAKLSESSDSN
ncbi:PREDICTED: DNA repair protein complementing XP-G cells isoform X2 [Polistes dominula]|uniref:DNA repair protein complementing XP-G cells isoform X2 n=1 Tax=Polistes dominula TaxID=743375 RepID=A0ABM1IX51_POLDO|nr:PREDICTED: DNA repair protein complementing XP-G cells isoform X2 [Polistes dominula]